MNPLGLRERSDDPFGREWAVVWRTGHDADEVVRWRTTHRAAARTARRYNRRYDEAIRLGRVRTVIVGDYVAVHRQDVRRERTNPIAHSQLYEEGSPWPRSFIDMHVDPDTFQQDRQGEWPPDA